MATYNIPTQGVPDVLNPGDILNAPYTGSKLTIALPAGQYKLECWGAGYTSTCAGGYSIGNLTLTERTAMWLYVGGKGTKSNESGPGQGGFNGGGSCSRTSYNGVTSDGYGGCGASDIRLMADNLYNRVIVAGGGGGYSYSYWTNYGYGGGVTGGPMYSNRTGSTMDTTYTTCANQLGSINKDGKGYDSWAAEYVGSFGKGANQSGTGDQYSTGGGGGGWYGGCAHNHDNRQYVQASGGSGFVYNKFSEIPSGYALAAKYMLTDAQTMRGGVPIIRPNGTYSTSGYTGDGYIRITVLPLNKIFGEKTMLYKKSETEWIKIKSLNEGKDYYEGR